MRTRLLRSPSGGGSIGAARGVCTALGAPRGTKVPRRAAPPVVVRRRQPEGGARHRLGLLLRADDHLDDGVTRRERTLMQMRRFSSASCRCVWRGGFSSCAPSVRPDALGSPCAWLVRAPNRTALPAQLLLGVDGPAALAHPRRGGAVHQSFVEIRRHSRRFLGAEASFHALLRRIYDRHAPTLLTMARGVHSSARKWSRGPMHVCRVRQPDRK